MKRGEIYFVTLDPVVGREQSGRRPVLVISDDSINSRPLVITVVIGTSGERLATDFPTNIRIPAVECGLPRETVFLCFQLRSIDHTRFFDSAGNLLLPAGKLSPDRMKLIDHAIRLSLSLLA